MEGLQSQAEAIYGEHNAALAAAGCAPPATPPQFVAIDNNFAAYNFVDTGIKVAVTFQKGFGHQLIPRPVN